MRKEIASTLGWYLMFIFILSIIFSIVAFQIVDLHKNDIFVKNQEDYLDNISTAIYLLGLTLSMLFVFLNLFKPIRNTILLSFLTFYLIPAGLVFAFYYSEGPNTKMDPVTISSIIFFGVVTFFYLRFLFFIKKKRQSDVASL